jgi:hypothetical protein
MHYAVCYLDGFLADTDIVVPTKSLLPPSTPIRN